VAYQICPAVNENENEEPLICLYGGSCIGSEFDGDASFYECDCPPSRTGTHCEIPLDTQPDTGSTSSSTSATTTTTTTNTTGNGSNLSSGMIFVLILVVGGLLLFVGILLFYGRRRSRHGGSEDGTPPAQSDTTTREEDGPNNAAGAAPADGQLSSNSIDPPIDDGEMNPVTTTQATIV
jgi:hypothetical protein